MTDTMTNRLSPGHIRVLIQEMDRARRVIDDAQRIHDSLAAELGFERVRIDDVKQFDAISVGDGFDTVMTVTRIVDKDGIASFFEVVFFGGRSTTYDDGEVVSRRLPEAKEPF